MDVKTLCLGVLTEGDRTGYEIKQRFEDAFSHFFTAGYGSIYPALADLQRQGLVTCESVEQDKRPDKKVYSLTRRGRDVLVGDLAATPPRHKVRSEFLVLMYFAHLLPPPRLLEVMEEMVAHWRQVLAEIEACTSAAESGACAHGPGLPFVTGYGRTVIGAAAAYVESEKHRLTHAVAALEEPAAEDLEAAE